MDISEKGGTLDAHFGPPYSPDLYDRDGSVAGTPPGGAPELPMYM
ncbi:hypothetical protein ACWDAO_07305 [Streptomyces sp. NPDC001212]